MGMRKQGQSSSVAAETSHQRANGNETPMDTLKRIQAAFSTITGLRLLLVDTDGTVLLEPRIRCDICDMRLHESEDVPHGEPQGESQRQQCVQAYGMLAKQAYVDGPIVRSCCHDNDLCVGAVPVVVSGHPFGAWICGPVALNASNTKGPHACEKHPEQHAKQQAEQRLHSALTLLNELGPPLELPLLASVQYSDKINGDTDTESQARIGPDSLSMRDIIDTLDDPVFVKDTLHRWVFVNTAFCNFMGISREKLLGKSDYDFLPPSQAKVFWDKDDEAFASGSLVTNEEQLNDATGKTHIVSTKKSVFVGRNGRTYLVAIIRDITDRHKLDAELARHREHLEELVQERAMLLSEANQKLHKEMNERMRAETDKLEMQAQIVHQQKLEAIGRLAGGIAHDFNNLLTGIIGHITLAMRDQTVLARTQESMRQVLEAAKRAAALTRQLLAFSRKQIIEPRIIDLNDLIGNLENLLERIVGEQVKLVTDFETGLAPVMVDPIQMEQVIVNLAVNARDAMPEGGTLVIQTRNCSIDNPVANSITQADTPNSELLAPGDYVSLSVTDTGVGIDEHILPKIYDPFFTTKPKGQGTGLGLSTAYGIIKQHRGAISVSSVPRQGTIFKVLMPVYHGTEPTSSTSDQLSSLPQGSECILLVEDEPLVRLATQRMLQRLGYHVLSADSAQQALATSDAYKSTIHLLLTDVVMPSMNGHQLAKTMSARRPNIKVMFTSGYADEALVGRNMRHLKASFIAKPFDSITLAKAVREALQ